MVEPRLESLQNGSGISHIHPNFFGAAVFVSLNNSSIVPFCCFTEFSRLFLLFYLDIIRNLKTTNMLIWHLKSKVFISSLVKI